MLKKKKMVDKNNLYGSNIEELNNLIQRHTKEELALIVMAKEEKIWDLMAELDTKTYDLILYKISPYYEEREV